MRGEGCGQVGFGFIDQGEEIGVWAVPFQHGEFGGMAGGALAVSKHSGELEDGAGAAGEEFFHREFGAGVQIFQGAGATILENLSCGENIEMYLLAWGGHDDRGFDLGVAAGGEEGAGGSGDQAAAAQERQARGEAIGMPGRGLGHDF